MRLLVVEDDPVQAEGLRAVLGRCERRHEVTVSGTLAGALALLAAGGYDCVLLDLGLPDASGVAGCRDVVRAAPRTPVVVVTGASEEEVGLDCLRAGAQEFLAKGRLDEWSVCRAVDWAVARQERQDLGRGLRALGHDIEDALARGGESERTRTILAIVDQLRGLAEQAWPSGEPARVRPETQPPGVQVESLAGGGLIVHVPAGQAVQVEGRPPQPPPYPPPGPEKKP